MIDKVCSVIKLIATERVSNAICDTILGSVQEVGNSVSQMNCTLYRCCSIVKDMIPDERIAQAMCERLYRLQVPVSRRVVFRSIRANRGMVNSINPSYDPEEIECDP